MFLGYKKNFNYKKNAEQLKKEFLKPGEQTIPFFADSVFITKQVGQIKKPDDLNKLLDFIKTNVKRQELTKAKKFERTAKEIWVSGYAEDCSDYALVFESIARQIKIPTIHIQLAEKDWIKSKKVDGVKSLHGVECLVDGKWIFVNPTNNEIIKDYNPNQLKIKSKTLATTLEVFSKSTDLFETGVKNLQENNTKIKNIYKKQIML